MKPTAILRRFFTLLLTGTTFLPPASAAGPETPVDRFNYVLGTQTIGASYQFEDKPVLLETAGVIQNMGATVLKFSLGPDYKKDRRCKPGMTSLTDLASHEPAYRAVLDMPFAHFVLWTNTFSHNPWQDGLSPQEADREYREVYEFATHLLKTYRLSGKTFYLGHWEGDGMLRRSVSKEDDAKVTPEKVAGMIAWLNVRQQAVDDAKRDTPPDGMAVWHYTEVNHVVLAMDQNRPALVNQVLPHVPVDFVSYSAYDTTNRTEPQKIRAALDFIEARLAPKPAISGKRVFIGEYGFPALLGKTLKPQPPKTTNEKSLVVMQTGIQWGCPLVLYWELYNNEVGPGGEQIGYWMIDSTGTKMPVYHTHQRYYAWARQFVSDTFQKTGAVPDDSTFRTAAAAFLETLRPRTP
jgi:hypothetical protein